MLQPIFGPSSVGRSERYIEYDWALSQLEGTVLDVGAMDGAGTVRYFREAVAKLGHPYTTLDLITEAQGIKTDLVCDIRDSGIPTDAYDTVTCLSTLEHIEEPQVALAEMARIGRNRVLLTMPFGRYEKHPWGMQYDQGHLDVLLKGYSYMTWHYRYEEGWEITTPDTLVDRGYAERAPFAAGVVCVRVTL